jgi:TPR repeat protein
MKDMENIYNKALREFENAHFSNAMFYFKKSLKHNYDQSMYYLGMMYELGLGTKDKQPNNEQAFICYYESYKSGNVKAAQCFARAYKNFEGKLDYLNHKYPEINIQQIYNQISNQMNNLA